MNESLLEYANRVLKVARQYLEAERAYDLADLTYREVMANVAGQGVFPRAELAECGSALQKLEAAKHRLLGTAIILPAE